jgi:hypothetical protein
MLARGGTVTMNMSHPFDPKFTRENYDLYIPLGTILMKSDHLTYFDFQWLPCDGRSVLRSAYPELFKALGTAFGSDDSLTFKLPDLRRTRLHRPYVIRVK